VLVSFLSSVNYTGRTSMEIGIKVITENIRNKSVRHANSCFFTMVAVDDDGKAVPVAPLLPATPDEERRPASAMLRRELRQEYERRHRDVRKPAQA
jgi:acyl-CoA hydrolase